VPACVWVGVGVLLAVAWGKVAPLFSLFRGGAGGGAAGGNAQEKMMGWVRPGAPLGAGHCAVSVAGVARCRQSVLSEGGSQHCRGVRVRRLSPL